MIDLTIATALEVRMPSRGRFRAIRFADAMEWCNGALNVFALVHADGQEFDLCEEVSELKARVNELSGKVVVMKKIAMVLTALVLVVPQEALAANVYVPVICEPIDDDELDCYPDHDDASYNAATDTWVIEVSEGDTVYLQVSDFTHGGQTWAVSAETDYATHSVTWSKTGSTATSPGATPDITFYVDFDAHTTTSPTKLGHGRRRFEIEGVGA